LGIWIFGWDKLSKGLHAAVMWFVAIGTILSAFWILIANMFMQRPVGYAIIDDRAVLTDFFEVLTNYPIFSHYPHVISAGMATAAFFMLGVSAYHLFRHNETDLFRTSFRMASIIGLIASISVGIFGHTQGQQIIHYQPMKLASFEALFETEDPASLSLLTIKNPFTDEMVLDLRIPGGLSFMEFNRFEGEVQGINQLQDQYEQKYKPGDYVPPPVVMYWSFRVMVGAGLLMIAISLFALFIDLKNLYNKFSWFIKLLPLAIALPYLANTTGWIITEMGRFPWIVYTLVKLEDGVSIILKNSTILISLIGFMLVYGLLIIATLYLMFKYAKAGPMAAPDVLEEVMPSLVNPPETL
jgi:cytochrome d ubiquinol oxidase subunit I